MSYQTFLAGVASASLALAAVPAALAQEEAQEPAGIGAAVEVEGTNEAIDQIDPTDPFGDIFGDMTLEEIDSTDPSFGEDLSDVDKEQLRIRCAKIVEAEADDTFPAEAIGVCTALADELEPPTEPAGNVEMQDISPDSGAGETGQADSQGESQQ